MSYKADIILATYNGARYLKEQIDSIISQSFQDWRLIIHDDGSTDATLQIIEDYKFILGDRLYLVQAESQGGASQNFNLLLTYTEADYVFFSDQDDIWLPHKLSTLLLCLQETESKLGKDTPILAHSDLKVVDAYGNERAASFWSFQNLSPDWGSRFSYILTQNIVTGCAMVVNRSLIEISGSIPKKAVMHDWWLALIACAFGRIVWVNQATVLYRQHENNQVGAQAFDTQYVLRKMAKVLDRTDAQRSLNDTTEQALAFITRYPSSPHTDQAKIYTRLAKMSSFERRWTIISQRFFKIGILRNIAWILLT